MVPAGGWMAFWLTLVGSAALFILGLAVAMARPRNGRQRLLAGYCLGIGLIGIFGALFRFDPDDWRLLAAGLFSFLAVIAAACLVALARATFPPEGRPSRWSATVAGMLLAALVAVLGWEASQGDFGPDGLTVLPTLLRITGSLAILFAHLQFLLLAAQAFPAASRRSFAEARQLAFAAAGVAAAPTVVATTFVLSLPGLLAAGAALRSILFSVLAALPLVLVVSAWLVATSKADLPASRLARNVVLAVCIVGVVAALFTSMVADGTSPTQQGLNGFARFVGAALLAYAVLRHQMFDIDIKLKWTLIRGTVAFAFLAVFFVAAQLAQNFLSDQYGWALGGVAAGLLLFALAPIQRAAERLSDKAMPNVKPDDPAYVLRKKRETYRNAYATAWADGTMTQKDMRMLHQVREALALPEKDVLAIEKDWARSSKT